MLTLAQCCVNVVSICVNVNVKIFPGSSIECMSVQETYEQRWQREHPRVVLYLKMEEYELLKRLADERRMTIKDFIVSLLRERGRESMEAPLEERREERGVKEQIEKIPGFEKVVLYLRRREYEIIARKAWNRGLCIEDWLVEAAVKYTPGLEIALEDARKSAKTKYDLGYSRGYDDGYAKGYEDGKNVGYKKGYEKGYEDGQAALRREMLDRELREYWAKYKPEMLHLYYE